MGDIILFIVVVVAFTTVWIEWLPRRYDILIGIAFAFLIIGAGLGWIPNWYGWVVTLLGLASLARQYYKGVREFGWPKNFSRASKPVTHASVEKETAVPAEPEPSSRTRTPRRVWIGGIALTALSPVTAIPAVIVLAMVLVVVNSMMGDAESLALGFTQITKSVLGNAFVILVGTLDLVLRGILISGPLFLLVGIVGAKWADRTGCYWQRLFRASMLIGALYPAIFVVANILGWFDEPFFN